MAGKKAEYNREYNKEHYYKPSIYLPPDYKERLKQAALKHTGGNVSQLVTQAIDEYLKKYDGEI